MTRPDDCTSPSRPVNQNSSSLADDADALSQLIAQQLKLYNALSTLVEEQHELVDQGAADQLLALLGKRQRIVDDLAVMDSDLAPYKARWPQIAAELNQAQCDSINSMLEQARDLLNGIIDRDNQDRQSLQSQKSRVGDELSRVTHIAAARQAYQSSEQRPTDNVYTNQQG